MRLAPMNLCLAVLLACATSPAAAAADALAIYYEDRAPYYVTGPDGTQQGLVSKPVADALAKAGIESRWIPTPSSRQLRQIQDNRVAACSPGWFKRPERMAFAKFSDVVYQDKPQVVVGLADNAALTRQRTLATLFENQDFRAGLKQGFSYGPVIDGLIASRKPRTVSTTQPVDGMVRMLIGRRFDYMIMAAEEFETTAERLGIAGDVIIEVGMADIPPGNERYLMCSRAVPNDVIRRFNTALAGLGA